MANYPVVTLNEAIITPELTAIIYGSEVRARFRYELLNNANVSKGYLNCVMDGGSVENNYLADVKRKCSLTISEIGNFSNIDFLNDRIKPYYEIFSKYRSSWLSFPLGVYVLSSGSREHNRKLITRGIEGFDLTQILKRKKHLSRFVVPVASDPIDIVRGLLNDAGISHNIEDNPDVVNDLISAERSYDPGQEYILTINDLLSMVNYRSLYFDNNGFAVSSPYTSPQDRILELGYTTDDASVVSMDASLSIETSEIPNVVQVIVSQPDRPVIVGIARNDNPDSVTSTVARGEEITFVSSDNEDVTSQDQANAKARRILAEKSQIYETIQFNSAIVPLHGENTILGITHTDLGISDIYSETEWRMPLSVGGLMSHSARRLVSI